MQNRSKNTAKDLVQYLMPYIAGTGLVNTAKHVRL
jgi:hypothetical protein